MNICDVNRRAKPHKRRQRRGRGPASGLGKTCGRGQKGKGARRGTHWLRGFVGGQTPLRARLPKRGFSNAVFRVEYVPVNVGFLQERFDAGAVVGPEEMRRCGVGFRQGERIKILGNGDLTKAITVRAHAFSASAKAKIEKAGGAAEMIA